MARHFTGQPLRPNPMPAVRGFRRLAIPGSILGLVAGVLLGGVSHDHAGGPLAALSPYVKAFGTLWLNALTALVVPLTAVNVIKAVLRGRDAKSTGVQSARALGLFVIWLAIGAAVTLLLVPPVLAQWTIDRTALSALISAVPTDAITAITTAPPPTSASDVVAIFVPSNLFKAVVNGELLPILIFSIAFAFAAIRSGEPHRATLTAGVEAIADALLVIVGWLIHLLPAGAFALAFVFSESVGFGLAGLLGEFTLLTCLALLGFTVLLYPLTALLGRVSMVRFARAVLPAQIAAVTTRSSIASLPALLDGAARELRMSPAVANLTLPLSVAVFKVNRTISSSVKMLFIAHMFGIQLGVMQIVTFVVSVMILSFTSLGVPGGGGAFKSLAAYVAIGLPIEGYVLLETTDAIVDVFKTLLNVTGDMSVASVVERLTPRDPMSRTDASARPVDDEALQRAVTPVMAT
jgi:proton glutamate symport protein